MDMILNIHIFRLEGRNELQTWFSTIDLSPTASQRWVRVLKCTKAGEYTALKEKLKRITGGK